jgi:hypothetical protein
LRREVWGIVDTCRNQDFYFGGRRIHRFFSMARPPGDNRDVKMTRIQRWRGKSKGRANRAIE